MKDKETLRQYLSYNKSVDGIEQIFCNLDTQMKYLHKKGYYVKDLNSDTILLEEYGVPSKNRPASFSFSSIERLHDMKNVSDNIVDLSKLMIGAFISVENGFCDYTNLEHNYIKKYFEEMSYYIPNADYFRNVILNNDTSMYYSDFILENAQRGKSNANHLVKSNNYGKMYVPDEEAAFAQIVLYPVLIVTVIAIVAILSRFF